MLERRTFYRYPINAPVEIDMDEGNVTVRGICRNLSGSGLIVEMPIKPELFSSAILRIDLSRLGGGTKVVPAMVVRIMSRETKEGKSDEVAFAFDSSAVTTRGEIDLLLRHAFRRLRFKYLLLNWITRVLK